MVIKISGLILLATISLIQAQTSSPVDTHNKQGSNHLDLIKQAIVSTLHLSQPKKIDPIFLRTGNDLCKEEKNSIAGRQPKIHRALEQLLSQRLDKESIPKIGIVTSGGGARAMISTIGLLEGLSQTGVLDCCEYISSLSGSTWGILVWLFQGISPLELGKFLREKNITKKIKLTDTDYAATINRILAKIAYDQPINFGDIFGTFLTALFFSNLPDRGHSLKLSSIQEKILRGNFPFPIFASIKNNGNAYEWFEVSPFEAGSDFLNVWSPIAAFGKKFKNGQSTDAAPEQPLGFFLSMFGSAYAVPFYEILFGVYQELKNSLQAQLAKLPLPHIVTKTLTDMILKNFDKFLNSDKSNFTRDLQFSPPEVKNLTYKIPGLPFEKEKYIQLFDAGIDFNLSFPSLMRRGVELMIVTDASASISLGLKGASNYAKRKGYSFPPINFTDIDKKRVSLFYDENDSSAPVIVYCPNLKPFPTLKFTYTDQEFKDLETFMHESGVQAKDTIIQAIKIAMRNKQVNSSIDSNTLSKILDQLDADYTNKPLK